MSVAADTLQTNGMWPVVWKLLGLRLMILYRSFRRARLRQKLLWIFLGIILVGVLGAVFFLSWSLLRFLQSPDLTEFLGDTRPLFESMPTLILSAVFIGILFTSFGVLLQALYLAGDMDFLLSTPIPIRSVFVAKLLQAIIPNFGLVCILALPVLYGMGASSGYHFMFYPGVLIVLSALALAAAGLASLLVMAVVRVFPARRVAEILGFVGAVASLMCSQTGQIANLNEFNPEQTQQALQMLYRVNNPLSPFTWAGMGLVRLGEMQWLAGLGTTVLVVTVCLAVFAVALVASERLYYVGWANMRAVSLKKKQPRRPPPSAMTRNEYSLFRRLSSIPLSRLIQKDFKVLRRDVRNMSQLVTPLILGIIYAVMLLRGGGDFPGQDGNVPLWLEEITTNIRLYSSVGLSLFVGWMLLGRLAGIGFSQEGKHYWLLKTAPVSSNQLIAAKYLVAYLPTLILCWGFLLITWILNRPGLESLLFSLPVVALVIAGNAGINLTSGILGANMTWEDPRQMQRGIAGCLGALLTMVYLVISLALFFGPAILGAALQFPPAAGQALGLAIGGVFSLACAVIPLWLVRGRVERLAEG